MKKLNAFLLAATMAGSVGLAAMTPSAYADERGPGMRKHHEQGQYMNARGMRGPRCLCPPDVLGRWRCPS